ncbi:DUF998 domain-containing protein [Microbispora sp. NPDC049125]|uniref:DUF998 domain-containing protein n=1 Tax=Microbispora sp. NPDC049125 TaxID=3154929 RepID=UPI003467B6F5
MSDTDHRAITARYLLAGGLAAPLFVVVALVESALRAGYVWQDRFVSELSLGDSGWIQVTNFLVTGVCLLAFAAGLRRVLPTGKGRRAAPVLAAVCGAGLIVAGLFTMDPSPGYPVGGTVPAHPTVHGQIHGYAPFAVFLSLAALSFVLARRFAGEAAPRVWMWYSIATGILVPATFMAGAATYDFVTQTGHNHGVWQRISLAIGFAWLGVLAVRLMREHAGSRRETPSPVAGGVKPNR